MHDEMEMDTVSIGSGLGSPAPGCPSLTQPSHTAPAQRRAAPKVKSDAQALRSGPCACPQAQVQMYDRARHTTAPRSIHSSTPSYHPSLPSRRRFENADVDEDGARTSALQAVLGSRQSGGRPTRGVMVQSATSRCTCLSLALTPDGLRASPALPTCSLVWRAPRPPSAYFLAPLSYIMLSASKSGE
ncbi:hypothetical protein B0H14DRAFT_3888041 [Mycena olivaceomarginata]|nr:hypothetical protein B0H14DRAFT_3888041 [Mycena olivaceomarginata]